MAKLYEIAAELKLLWEEIERNDGVLEGSLEERLNTLPGDFRAKGLNVGLWIKNLESDRNEIKAEVERLAKKLKTATANEERAREYLFECMQNGGIDKIKHPAFTAYIQAGKEKVDDLIDTDKLPDEFKTVEVVVKPKKKEILEHYKKTGEVVEGTKIVDGRPYLVIR